MASSERECEVKWDKMSWWSSTPIPSMYGIFGYIWLIFMRNLDKYTIRGCYEYGTFGSPNSGSTNSVPSIQLWALISPNFNKFLLTCCKVGPLVQHEALLVGGWTTHLKNMLVKMGSSSPSRGENKKSLKPPPSYVWIFGTKILQSSQQQHTWMISLRS